MANDAISAHIVNLSDLSKLYSDFYQFKPFLKFRYFVRFYDESGMELQNGILSYLVKNITLPTVGLRKESTNYKYYDYNEVFLDQNNRKLAISLYENENLDIQSLITYLSFSSYTAEDNTFNFRSDFDPATINIKVIIEDLYDKKSMSDVRVENYLNRIEDSSTTNTNTTDPFEMLSELFNNKSKITDYVEKCSNTVYSNNSNVVKSDWCKVLNFQCVLNDINKSKLSSDSAMIDEYSLTFFIKSVTSGEFKTSAMKMGGDFNDTSINFNAEDTSGEQLKKNEDAFKKEGYLSKNTTIFEPYVAGTDTTGVRQDVQETKQDKTTVNIAEDAKRDILAHIMKSEGLTNYAYLDSKGVAIGIGFNSTNGATFADNPIYLVKVDKNGNEIANSLITITSSAELESIADEIGSAAESGYKNGTRYVFADSSGTQLDYDGKYWDSNVSPAESVAIDLSMSTLDNYISTATKRATKYGYDYSSMTTEQKSAWVDTTYNGSTVNSLGKMLSTYDSNGNDLESAILAGAAEQSKNMKSSSWNQVLSTQNGVPITAGTVWTTRAAKQLAHYKGISFKESQAKIQSLLAKHDLLYK